MAQIHPTAIVDPDAELDPSVRVGPYAVIEAGVTIGPGCEIASHAVIYRGTRLGAGNRVLAHAMLGCEPQDLGFSPDKGRPLVIGARNTFKEAVQISRGVKADHGTRIGDDNYFMGAFHAGHDCLIGNRNVLGHGSVLAGHVTIGDGCFVSGVLAVHQFCRIGDHAMLAGCAKIVKDIPPFTIGDGNPARVCGVNSVGLRRAGFAAAERAAIKAAYRVIYLSGLNVSQALARLQAEPQPAVVERIIRFFEQSERGVTAHRSGRAE